MSSPHCKIQLPVLVFLFNLPFLVPPPPLSLPTQAWVTGAISMPHITGGGGGTATGFQVVGQWEAQAGDWRAEGERSKHFFLGSCLLSHHHSGSAYIFLELELLLGSLSSGLQSSIQVRTMVSCFYSLGLRGEWVSGCLNFPYGSPYSVPASINSPYLKFSSKSQQSVPPGSCQDPI